MQRLMYFGVIAVLFLLLSEINSNGNQALSLELADRPLDYATGNNSNQSIFRDAISEEQFAELINSRGDDDHLEKLKICLSWPPLQAEVFLTQYAGVEGTTDQLCKLSALRRAIPGIKGFYSRLIRNHASDPLIGQPFKELLTLRVGWAFEEAEEVWDEALKSVDPRAPVSNETPTLAFVAARVFEGFFLNERHRFDMEDAEKANVDMPNREPTREFRTYADVLAFREWWRQRRASFEQELIARGAFAVNEASPAAGSRKSKPPANVPADQSKPAAASHASRSWLWIGLGICAALVGALWWLLRRGEETEGIG